jgi:hypothetical protein
MTILLSLAEKLKKLDNFISVYSKLFRSKWFILRGGHTCSICSRKGFFFKNGTNESFIDSNKEPIRMILSFHLTNGTICPICAKRKIFEYFDNISLKSGKCDFTGRNDLPVASNIRLGAFSCHFGSNWWNGHFANRAAFELAFLKMSAFSNILTYFNSKRYFNDGDSGQYLIQNEFDVTEWIRKQEKE